LPENFDINNSDSFGLKLVSTLIDQINGKLDVEFGNGSSLKISFSAKETKTDY